MLFKCDEIQYICVCVVSVHVHRTLGLIPIHFRADAGSPRASASNTIGRRQTTNEIDFRIYPICNKIRSIHIVQSMGSASEPGAPTHHIFHIRSSSIVRAARHF